MLIVDRAQNEPTEQINNQESHLSEKMNSSNPLFGDFKVKQIYHTRFQGFPGFK